MPATKKPGDTFSVEFKFNYTGPTADLDFEVELGAIGVFGIGWTGEPGLHWERSGAVAEGVNAPKEVTLPDIMIPSYITKYKTYDGRGRVFYGGKELAADEDANVIQIVSPIPVVKVEGLDVVYEGKYGAG